MFFGHLAHVELALGVVQPSLQVTFLVHQHAVFRRHSVLIDLQPFDPVRQTDYPVFGLLVQLRTFIQKTIFNGVSDLEDTPTIYCVLVAQLVDEPLHRVLDTALGGLNVPVGRCQAHGQ